jgi:hypothetical protein
MAKNKAILICLLWVFSILPTNSLVSNDGYCVKLTAESFIGIVEKGGNNKGFTDPYFRKLMEKQGWRPGYAWCSFFVMGVLGECGIPHTITGWSPTAYNRKDVIFTNGKFLQSYSTNDVLVMTLSYGDKNSKTRYKGIGHTGIVELVGKYSVRTVEGNTNDRGTRDSRTGDGVFRKVRPLSRNLHITRWKKA